MNENTTKSDLAKFWTSMQSELMGLAARTVRGLKCPPAFARSRASAPRAKMSGWVSVREALAGDQAFLEDALGDVFVAILNAGSRFPTQHVERRGWAWVVTERTVTRQAYARARQMGAPLETSLDGQWEVARAASPEATAIRRVDTAPLVARLIADLSDDDFWLLAAKCNDELFVHLASAEGRAAATIRSDWFRLRKRILDWPEVVLLELE